MTLIDVWWYWILCEVLLLICSSIKGLHYRWSCCILIGIGILLGKNIFLASWTSAEVWSRWSLYLGLLVISSFLLRIIESHTRTKNLIILQLRVLVLVFDFMFGGGNDINRFTFHGDISFVVLIIREQSIIVHLHEYKKVRLQKKKMKKWNTLWIS